MSRERMEYIETDFVLMVESGEPGNRRWRRVAVVDSAAPAMGAKLAAGFNRLQEDPRDAWDLGKVEPAVRVALINYVCRGGRLGSFLAALVRNDFAKAVASADGVNAQILKGWQTMLTGYLPAPCWGSESKVAAWRVEREKREWPVTSADWPAEWSDDVERYGDLQRARLAAPREGVSL